MAYFLKVVTIRANNSIEGMKKIGELWQDIMTGKLPLLFDNEHTFQQSVSPVARYDNYDSDEKGDFDFSILGVTSDFFAKIEEEVIAGKYKKYDEADDDIIKCTKKAWSKVWNEQKTEKLHRAFSADFESSVSAEYANDGKAHCYLYIAIQQNE